MTAFSANDWFFHDKRGLSHHAENLRAFENIFKTKEPVRRDRVVANQEVFPLGRFGVFHRGSRRLSIGARVDRRRWRPSFCQASARPAS
jgi:hypothetical protein